MHSLLESSLFLRNTIWNRSLQPYQLLPDRSTTTCSTTSIRKTEIIQSHSRIVQTSTMATPNFVTPQQTMYPVPYPNIPQVPTFTPAPGIPPAMSNFYQPPLPVVAPVPMATVLPVTAASPAVVPSIPNHIVAPTSVLGNGGFRSGGFNLFGDTDTTTTVVQSRVGIVTGSAQVL